MKFSLRTFDLDCADSAKALYHNFLLEKTIDLGFEGAVVQVSVSSSCYKCKLFKIRKFIFLIADPTRDHKNDIISN